MLHLCRNFDARKNEEERMMQGKRKIEKLDQGKSDEKKERKKVTDREEGKIQVLV